MKTINRLTEAQKKFLHFFSSFLRPSYLNQNSSIYRNGYTQDRLPALVKLLAAICALLFMPWEINAQPDVKSHLGPFELQLRAQNPLREPIHFTSRPTPVSLDQDKDGDLDVVLADFYGGNGFDLLRNDGSASAAAFNYAMYYDNPYNYLVFGNGGTPSFSDLDKDGDLDMLLGLMDGTFRYYRNNSTKTNAFTLLSGAWNAATKTGNPMNGVDLGDYASPVFFDLDNDGDDDLIIGTSFLPNNKSIHYYVNDGLGNFSVSALSGINPNLDETTPTIIDVDGDGASDIIVGAADGNLYYFKRTGTTSFIQQTGTGNPFNGINKGLRSSPTSGDFDHDGDVELLFGAENLMQDLFYLDNKGNGIFEEKISFENPFGGITVIRDASPFFIDIDKDGKKDLLLSGWYGNQKIKYLRNVNGKYVEESSNNPFTSLTFPNLFTPSLVDLDGDGDYDLAGGGSNNSGVSIEYYKNENGTFVNQLPASSPFSSISIDEGKTDFVDIDNDGDADLFIGTGTYDGYTETHFVRFYENTGSAQWPVFTERTGTENPASQVLEEFTVYPRFLDIDHDGDFDMIAGEGGDVIEMQDGNEFSYYENIGTISKPKFSYRGDLIPQADRPFNPSPAFTDYDNDGDLDLFLGGSTGDLHYYKNTNPPALATINPAPLNIQLGAPPAFIDSEFTISDSDNDSIVYASVSVSGYVKDKHFLAFSPQAGVAGSFTIADGVLTFTGKAPLAVYQTLLRSVTFEFKEGSPSGRVRSTNSATISNVITFTILDSDGTRSLPVSRTLNVVSGQPPIFADHSISMNANASRTIDLVPLIADADNDADLSTLAVVTQPASGAISTIDANFMLTLDYTNTAFAGTENVTLNVCDKNGACDQSTISITVTNTTPVFSDETVSVTFGKSFTIDLKPLITDTENNIDWPTLTVITPPASGASATIDANGKLTVNYNSKSFSGAETATVRICDKVGACDNALISISVTNTAPMINSMTLALPFGGQTIADIKPLISDAESNVDFSTLSIVEPPSSGALASINSNFELAIDYTNVLFAGSEGVTIKICDAAGACAQNAIVVTVTNASPVIATELYSIPQRSVKTVNLITLTSDPDGNLAPATLEVVGFPASGANTMIEYISPAEVNLVLNYSELSFSGTDQVKIKVCDLAGACSENVLTIVVVDVERPVEVFNAVAPNSSGDNRYMRILNLPANNKVDILNRWGDVVYTIRGYDHETPGRRFEGYGISGNALPTGTYYYKIEFTKSDNTLKTLAGYLSLKQ